MPLIGNNNQAQNNNSNKPYDPTVYSYYRFNNYNSPLGPVNMNFSYWKGMLKIAIVPMIKDKGGQWTYDNDNEIAVHLNHTKAQMLADRIEEFRIGQGNGCGVSVGQGDKLGLITISTGSDYRINNPTIVIRKLDSTGKILSDIAYPINTNTHYFIKGVADNNITQLNPENLDTVNLDDLELGEMVRVLESYTKAMTNAVAYSVVDQFKWIENRIHRKLDAICTNLGVNFKSSGNNGANSDIFNRHNRSYSNASSYYDDYGDDE